MRCSSWYCGESGVVCQVGRGVCIHRLAFHILGTDQQLAAQLRDLERGKSAAEAFDLEVHGADRSAGILLDSVDDLMRVVAARNHELHATNQSLEARVAERSPQKALGS